MKVNGNVTSGDWRGRVKEEQADMNMKTSAIVIVVGVAFIVALMFDRQASAQDAAGALKAAGIGGGLVVHIPVTDGKFEAEFAQSGTYLVHGLALDGAALDAARAALIPGGRYGLASVVEWQDRSRLPYASNLVNLLVIDGDALKDAAPKPEEIQRVLAPQGVLLERRGGVWKQSVKDRPASMDDWEHYDHGPDGNPVSTDTLVTPVRQQQWLTWRQPTPWEGNPAAYTPGAGIRIWHRFAVMDLADGYAPGADKKGSKNSEWVLHCRDAFNGTPLWSIPRDADIARRRWSLVTADGKVYCWLKSDGPLTAIDLSTGKTVRTYEQAKASKVAADESLIVRVAGPNLIVGLGDRLLCLDAASGEQRWAFVREGKLVVAPVVDAARGKVYALISGAGAKVFRSRWPASSSIQSVVAIDLKAGTLDWESTDAASVEVGKSDKGEAHIRGIGQLIPSGDYLFAFGSAAIGGGKSPFVGAIDPKNGKVIYSNDKPFDRTYNTAAYNMLCRDGVVYFAGAFTNVWRYDPKAAQI